METSTGAEFISAAHVRHVMRYIDALNYLNREQLVIDAACGTGYGSKILATKHNVIGIDFDADAITEAKKEPASNCRFMRDNILTANMNANAIVSIETIEHFSKDDGLKLLANYRNWLSVGDPLIISTPYCIESGPSPITKQHLWEYSLTDFERALAVSGFKVAFIKTDLHEGQAGRLGYCMAKARKR